jgi:hypothetical protein
MTSEAVSRGDGARAVDSDGPIQKERKKLRESALKIMKSLARVNLCEGRLAACLGRQIRPRWPAFPFSWLTKPFESRNAGRSSV